MVAAQQRFPEVVGGVEQFLSRYSQELDAIERGDERAATKLAVSAIDAIVFTITLLRDINVGQAESMPAEHPQSHLQRSVVRTFDAMLAVLALDRASAADEAMDREAAAAAVIAAALDIRQHAALGRRAAATMSAVIAADRVSGAEMRAMQANVLAAFETYGASFDRESEIAGILDAIASLLRDRGRSYDEVASELDALHLRLESLETERMALIERRNAMIQGR